jgi:hypothetical protein
MSCGTKEVLVFKQEKKMSFLKLNISLAFVIVAILTAGSQPALADTKTLICETGLPLDMGPTTIDLNEAQHTVTLHLPALRNSSIPARTAGPLPATFSPDTINFVWKEAEGYLIHTYVLNRLTAVVQMTAVNTSGGPGFSESWTCHVGKAQF